MGTATYDFDGETVVVTGGSSGIGRAVARRFGDAGATVVVADLREDPRDVEATAPTHEAIRDDGGVDVMVNNVRESRSDSRSPSETRGF